MNSARVDAQASGAPDREKGFFDHFVEYLRPEVAVEPAGPSAGPEEADDAVDPPGRAPPAPEPEQEGPAPPPAADNAIPEQSFVFTETAEELVVEKEFFIREEVVIRKLIEDHVHVIDDQVKRTEVEVERIPPPDAAPSAPAPEIPPAPQEARAAQSASKTPERVREKPQPRAGTLQASHDLAWWAWRILMFAAAVILAFAAGQILGSFFPAE